MNILMIYTSDNLLNYSSLLHTAILLICVSQKLNEMNKEIQNHIILTKSLRSRFKTNKLLFYNSTMCYNENNSNKVILIFCSDAHFNHIYCQLNFEILFSSKDFRHTSSVFLSLFIKCFFFSFLIFFITFSELSSHLSHFQ